VNYVIPVRAVVEAASAAEAAQAAQKIEELLGQSIVKFTLRGKGVKLVRFKVETPQQNR
jgi:hypothetical protein